MGSVKSKNTSLYYTTVEVYLIHRFNNVRKQYTSISTQQEEKQQHPPLKPDTVCFISLKNNWIVQLDASGRLIRQHIDSHHT